MRDEYDLDSMQARQSPYAERQSDQDLRRIIEEATLDAYGVDEGMCGFEACLEDQVDFPVQALVIGHRVQVLGVNYGGSEHRGLIARIRTGRGDHEVSLLDVRFEADSEAARFVAAYKKWLGM